MATRNNSTLELVSEAPESQPVPEFLRQPPPPSAASSVTPSEVQAKMLALFRTMAMVLAARFLLLLAILFGGLLSALAVMDQSIPLQKLVMVGVFDALLIFPLVLLNLRKG